jgi:hypothetical protein
VSLPGYNPASPEVLQAFAKHAWRKGNIAGMLTRYRGEPTLVLFHVEKMSRSFGIQQSRIDLYVDFETGSARLALAAKAQEAARHIGIDPIDANVNAIMGHDHVPGRRPEEDGARPGEGCRADPGGRLMERDYIMLMGPWGSTGPIDVTPIRNGEPLRFPDKLPEPVGHASITRLSLNDSRSSDDPAWR